MRSATKPDGKSEKARKPERIVFSLRSTIIDSRELQPGGAASIAEVHEAVDNWSLSLDEPLRSVARALYLEDGPALPEFSRTHLTKLAKHCRALAEISLARLREDV